MRYIVLNGLCCCLGICCKEVWETIYQIIGKKAFIKCLYAIIFLSSLLTTLAMMYIFQEWSWFMKYFAPSIQCNDEFQCLGPEVVYRVCACLWFFSVVMLIIMKLCSTRIAMILNEGMFFTKYVVIMILIMISFQMGASIFEAFGFLGSIFSYIVLIVQAIILMDLAYLWGINWAKQYSNGKKVYGFWLIVFTVIFSILALSLIIMSFFNEGPTWVSVIGLVQMIGMILIQLLNFNKQNSLLTTSLMCLVMGYEIWSCGKLHPQSAIDENFIYTDMSISFVMLWICTFGSIHGSTLKEAQIDLDSQQQSQEEKNSWVLWHLYLCGLAMLMTMILTNWGSADIMNKEYNINTNAWAYKIFFSLVTTVLYSWSLLAPRMFPQRNFYYE